MCRPQGAGPAGVLVALTVAGGQGFGHRRCGAVRRVGGPVQGELQRGTLGEALKGRQTLREGGMEGGRETKSSLDRSGCPRCSAH